MSCISARTLSSKGGSVREAIVTNPKRALTFKGGDTGSSTKSGAEARMVNTTASLLRVTSNKLEIS